MSLYAYLGAVYFISRFQECQNHYVDMFTNNRMRFMMYAMDRELVKDSWSKIMSVQAMKIYYTKSPSYHISERVFVIKSKFARMMRLYTTAHEKLAKLQPQQFQIVFFMDTMVEIQKLAMDIDNLVEMLTDFEAGPGQDVINVGGFEISVDIIKPGKKFNPWDKGSGGIGGGPGGPQSRPGGAPMPPLPQPS